MPFEFWEILRGVIGAGMDWFVYHPLFVHQLETGRYLAVVMGKPLTTLFIA